MKRRRLLLAVPELVLLALAVACSTVSVLAAAPVLADEDEGDWPRAIDAGEWTVTIYQPQVDSFEGVQLEARAAVSVRRSDGSGEPVFGAVWLSAIVDIDREERRMVVRELTVPEVRFGDSKPEHRASLVKLLETEIPKWELTLDLDRFVPGLGGDVEYATTPGIRSEPPKFVHSAEPAVLLLYDGEPRGAGIPGAEGLESVVNTLFPVVREKGANRYYLFGGEKYWYSAEDPLGPWTVTTTVPKSIRALMAKIEAPEGFGEPSQDIAPPKIVVATEPTELIVTLGEPKWQPIADLDLLYCDNTDADLFLDLTTQRYYVLASGRWFAGRDLANPLEWTHVSNDQLPEAFSRIPEDSTNGHVLAHVTGTAEAREEALQNAIPQTAAVKRDDASLTVAYDGAPDFEPVEGLSDVRFAVNTETPVFLANGRYWACDDAIWYVSDSAIGPWRVATEIPASLYQIPVSNPHYNVTYVHVYETTPQVVYVGYTPGYVGSYWYHGCVVWGTGWYYHPWYHHHYYHRPRTWGLNVRYSPYYGWGVGVVWTSGPFSSSWGWGGGYYGGWRSYRPPYDRPPYYRPYPPPDYSKPRPTPYPTRPSGAGRPAARPSDNIYSRPATRDRMAPKPTTRERARPAPLDAPNDVLTDRAGQVYRPTSSGRWETNDRGHWRPAEGLDRPAPQPEQRPSQQPSRQPAQRPTPPSRPPSATPSKEYRATRPQLEHDYDSRQRGSQRVQQRPSRSPSPRAAPRPQPRAAPRGGGPRR